MQRGRGLSLDGLWAECEMYFSILYQVRPPCLQRVPFFRSSIASSAQALMYPSDNIIRSFIYSKIKQLGLGHCSFAVSEDKARARIIAQNCLFTADQPFLWATCSSVPPMHQFDCLLSMLGSQMAINCSALLILFSIFVTRKKSLIAPDFSLHSCA